MAAVARGISAALAAVGLPVEAGERLELRGEPGSALGRLGVERVGLDCVGAALLAAAHRHEVRTGDRPAVSLDRELVRAALVSERLFRVEGRPAGAGFAPQSRFWRAADGWVRTHANYPWHHAALLAAVGVATDDGLADAIASRPAERIEEAVFEAGGVAAAVRTAAEWLAHPQGASVAAEPLVGRARIGDAEPRRIKPAGDVSAPAAGIRVLDLTRVIAGPVCSRYLGALGAEVLRLDPPDLPDLEPGGAADTLLGKRSALLDFRTGAAARRLESLLAESDAVLLGYRPGSLVRFGLSPEELARRHPGLVVLELSAWGNTGPWRGRRGFDSIVQAASGIALAEAGPDGEPGALPCQLLDHGTGYLAAAAVLVALAEQAAEGGSHLRRLSLARTAHWLLDERSGASPAEPGERWEERGAALVSQVAGDPSLAAVPPPGSLAGRPLRWEGRMGRYGTDEAAENGSYGERRGR